ncbi:MAG TPA: hypothetical protein DCY27_00700 [Desulfobacterales bacterium]|nr:hypothetical protein [Desulfobacterales bacterium]
MNLSWKVEPVYSFSINSGVVAWEFKQKDYAPNELVCVIYDPAQGKWVLNRVTDEEGWWYPEVKNKDGVVAYIAANDAGTISFCPFYGRFGQYFRDRERHYPAGHHGAGRGVGEDQARQPEKPLPQHQPGGPGPLRHRRHRDAVQLHRGRRPG